MKPTLTGHAMVYQKLNGHLWCGASWPTRKEALASAQADWNPVACISIDRKIAEAEVLLPDHR